MQEITERISRLFQAYGLGEIRGEIRPVSGGLMHRMFQVRGTGGVYAVKWLNPEIMKRPGVFDNFRRAEELEDALEEQGIPIVSAIRFGTKKMLKHEDRYYYIFRWQEGRITDYNQISSEQCRKAGEILGRIHGTDPREAAIEEPEISRIDFESYIRKAEEESPLIAELLKENLPVLSKAEKRLNEARRSLPPFSAIDDPDMDPKNVMWHQGEPHVIDLECLRRGNPVSSCLDLALQWAGTTNGDYRPENLEAFLRGYFSSYDNGFRAYEELFGIAYSWLDWLEYNIRRALGMEGSLPEEMQLGEEEVKNTLGRIRYLSEKEREVCEVLACCGTFTV